MEESRRYREVALELCQRANSVQDPDLRAEYEALAFSYMCLAEQAEREAEELAGCRDLREAK